MGPNNGMARVPPGRNSDYGPAFQYINSFLSVQEDWRPFTLCTLHICLRVGQNENKKWSFLGLMDSHIPW